ncbi:MAG: HNH endonuclease [bacterium]
MEQETQNLREGYCCGCIQTRPVTEDHIIPQAIGGKLKAPLCDECHKKIHAIDAELAKAFQEIATLLNVKRTRNENRPFRVKQVDTGIEFDIDSRKGRRTRPEVKIHFGQNALPIPEVKARSKDELNEILDGIRKKYGQFAKPIETISESIPIGLSEYENTIGGRLFMRAAAKSAYLFLAIHFPKEKISSEIFSSVRDFVFEDKGL